MKNADLVQLFDALTADVAALRQDLLRGGDLPATSAAPAIVAAMKLNRDLGRLAKAARKQLTPLFGKDAGAEGVAGQGDGKQGRKKK